MNTLEMAVLCNGCETNYFKFIHQYYEYDEASIAFLRKHGVLPNSVVCPKCDSQCCLREERKIWSCYNWVKIPKK